MSTQCEESEAICLLCGQEVSLENQTDAVACEELVCGECALRQSRRQYDADAS